MLYLKPKFGERIDGSKAPEPYILKEETEDGWIARPFMNPNCPFLFFPRFAWKEEEV